MNLSLPLPSIFICTAIVGLTAYLIFTLLQGLIPLDASLIRINKFLRGLERNSGSDPKVAEKIRELFKAEGTLYHHWQEFYESVATEHTENDSVLRATLPASNYFNFENLVHTVKWQPLIKFEVFSAAPSVLTGLGLLGTFYGLFSGLPEGQSPGQLAIGIGGFLREMKGAFVASMFGVAAGLIFNLIEKMARENVQSHCIELSNLIDQTFPRQTELEVLGDIRSHSDQQLAQFKSLAIDIGNEVARGITGNATSQVPIEAGLREGIAKGFGILAESLQQFAQVQQTFAESMMQMQTVQKNIADTFKTIQTSSQNSVEQIQSASGAIEVASKALMQVSESFPTITQQINAAVETQSKSSMGLATTSEAMLTSTNKLINQQTELQNQFKGTIENFDRVNSEFSKNVSEYHSRQNASLGQSLRSFDSAMAEAVTRLGSGVGNLNILMNNFVEKLDAVEKSDVVIKNKAS